jgi:cytoskeletal protein RodZ
MTRRVEQQGVSLTRTAGLFVLLVTAGCAGMDQAPQEPARSEVTQGKAPAPKPQPVEVKPEKPVVAKPAQVATKPDVPVVAKPVAPAAKPVVPDAKPAAKVAATPAPKKEVAAPLAPKPAAAPLDLAGLVKKLKETEAIGVFTKLTLKNQVDSLLEQFRGYYQGRVKTSLDQLRQPYDQLLMKVLSLLQDSDPPLAREIVQSREAIWGILSDPDKFDDL